MVSCQAVLTLQNENNAIRFKLNANWKSNSFDLIILTNDAWHAYISEEDLERLAKERNQNLQDYYTTLQDYLSETNSKVTYNLACDEEPGVENNSAEFTITRKIGARMVIFFRVILMKGNYQECIYALLDDLNQKNSQLSGRVISLQREKLDLEREKNIYEDKLIEFIERKTKWEQEMYSNFLLLLNEKKKRIKFLTSILKRKNIDPDEQPLDRELDVPNKKKGKRQINLEQLSDSDSSNSYGTDGYNTDHESSLNDNAERHEPTPSSSRQDLTSEDAGEEIPVLTLPKRVKKATNPEVVTLKRPVENDTAAEATGPHSPELDFSTQDLIDRM